MSKISPVYNCFEPKTTLKPKYTKLKNNEELHKNADVSSLFPNVHNKNIIKALNELYSVKFSPEDISYVNSLGAKLRFTSGKDAVNFLIENKTKIKFDRTSINGIFAQYNYKKNTIILNKEYSKVHNPSDILALSEAIIHETGHAKDYDGYNSIQEEIDNLALNVLTHKYFSEKYKGIFDNSDSPMIKDGVNKYSSLFYDEDPKKLALINRLKRKYGYLPLGDTVHPFSMLALKVKGF